MTSGSATTRLTQADRVYVGWHYARVHPDPGPPPRRPRPPEAEQISQSWLATQRRGENLLNRHLKITAAGAGVGALIFMVAWMSGLLHWAFAAVGLLACAVIILITGCTVYQSEKALRSRVNEERARLERQRENRQRKLNAAHEQHARAYREWDRRRNAYESQQEWYPVSVPPGADRVDVVGGTLAGWSAAVTMMGAARLAAGAQVTVLDLSEGAVAHDLVRLAGDRGDDPLVWVLPADLPRLDLTRELGPEAMADVLSLVVSASEEQSSTRDLSFDNAILERILVVFGGTASVRQLTAALRALAQVGDPRDDLRLGLITEEQLRRITTMFGRGAADQVVIERAWALESQLRKLEVLGTEPVRLPPSRLHVVSMDRRAGVLTNRVLGTYVATALTHVLRESPAGRRWDHTLFLCGAEKLRGDVLDRLIDACETTGTGLVLMYRSIPGHVRERLGRGHAAVGFMRLGNADDARVAAEHIGVEQRLNVAAITDHAGETVADLKHDPYASTVAYARARGGDALTDPGWSPLPDPAENDEALVRGINTATPWGRSIAEAARAGVGGPADVVNGDPVNGAPAEGAPASGVPAGGARVDGEPANGGAASGEPANDGPGDGTSGDGGSGDGGPGDGAPAQRDGGRRSRELLVEPHQMQELPPTAMIFTHATANGRRVRLVDANPGIMTLPTVHSVEYEEYLREQSALDAAAAAAVIGTGERQALRDGGPDEASRTGRPEPGTPQRGTASPGTPRARHAGPSGDGDARTPGSAPVPPSNGEHTVRPERRDPQSAPGAEPAGGAPVQPPPNLGPPPERLDFRRKKH
ncbi:hypothetical protein [Actinomadura sp. HBU206391]|uniref:hypothetical protein n=1 Tax=Actinomadura sp. HBU206391 TaxID=2731692 RepID=UPI002905938E|nr:hypothetical protein [Actinomadura sp. HBU206391]